MDTGATTVILWGEPIRRGGGCPAACRVRILTPMDLLPLVEPVVAPVEPKPPREIGLDVARALAVLGMLLAHFGAAAAGEDDGWAGSVTRFVDGRAMPLFVM